MTEILLKDQPEPCLDEIIGRCLAVTACAGWGYCRERNDGRCPDEATRQRFRQEAAARLADSANTRPTGAGVERGINGGTSS